MGVNQPATHVLVRDNTFPGIGRLEAPELLQMLGRAGRGECPGHGTVLVRPTDGWEANELANALHDEVVPEVVSPFERILARKMAPRAAGGREEHALTTCVAAHLARGHAEGAGRMNCRSFSRARWAVGLCRPTFRQPSSGSSTHGMCWLTCWKDNTA
jgi:hypothetical protein